MQSLILSIWLLLMASVLALAYWVIKNTPQAKRPKRKSPSRRYSRSPMTVNRNINPREWQELLVLLQGDTATANRLLDAEQRRHPDRSISWCLEKAVWQLKRDRN
jgi:hypothetical protein